MLLRGMAGLTLTVVVRVTEPAASYCSRPVCLGQCRGPVGAATATGGLNRAATSTGTSGRRIDCGATWPSVASAVADRAS
jgi:hypothetical protein